MDQNEGENGGKCVWWVMGKRATREQGEKGRKVDRRWNLGKRKGKRECELRR